RKTTVFGTEGISKAFGGAKALSNVSFQVSPGDIHCLAGENGSGKSTLIKIMSGVETPDSGTIILGDERLSSLTPREAVAKGVQVIFQDFSLIPNLTVAENIALSTAVLEKKKLINPQKNREIAAKALELIGVDLDLDATVRSIPVSSKQLVAIARAMTQGVKLLFMDEATTALTRKEIDHLFGVVRNLRDQGVATVFVSHKLDEVQEIAESITILRNGEVTAEGPIENFDRKAIAEAMTGQEVSEVRLTPELPKSAATVLEVEGLTSSGRFKNVSFSVKAGEIVGITGLLGSGRSEIAEALFGMAPIESGTVSVNGKKVSLSGPRDAVEAGIGYVPQDRLSQGLFLNQSIRKNVMAAAIERFLGKGGFVKGKDISETVSNWISDLKIKTDNPENAATSLSGGNQQRVVLAKWLAMTPSVLILNGPTVGVDIGSKKEILEIIRDKALEGMAVVIVSDDIPEIVQIAHRVMVVHQGKLGAELSEADISESRLYEELAA
ncbi:MAG: sugar ABC transporter ATP-binding protein, partial [Pontimonas sp.]